MRVEPYLFFDGRCEEAIEFYKKTLGAQVAMLMRFKDNPEPQGGADCAPGNPDKIMHACMSVRGTNIMASDGNAKGNPKFEGFSLSFPVKDEAEADTVFAALSDGGKVQMPLMKTFFSPRFGMVADKFGVGWMVIVNKQVPEGKSKDFVISRVFDAPRELVWQAFTDAKRLKEWWGPKGVKVIHSKMDLKPGGSYHYAFNTPDGSTIWGKFQFREIVPRERLVFISSFSDEDGGLTRHPMAPSWPMLMHSTFTFEDEPGGKTRVTIRWQAYQAAPEEQATFDAGHDSMRQGWGGSLDVLTEYLARASKPKSKSKPKAKAKA
jgi:uncharacterized glyoxalase superfamily protein PhnB/uncharacterized protein YndB with AHSA1/START domain